MVIKVSIRKKLKSWLNQEINEFKNYARQPYFLWASFWLLTLSTVFSFFISSFENKVVESIIELYKMSSTFYLFIGVICLFVCSGVFVFIVKPIKQLHTQNIHNQPSWIFYSYWSLVNALMFCALLLSRNDLMEDHRFPNWCFCLILPLIIILIKGVVLSIKTKKIDLKFTQFSSGAVGIADDRLDFNLSAKHVVDGILNLKNYVNVVGLYGGLGFGKSSYARMILENFNPNKTLYTYISLTETNEAKDFSKLFSERWLDTLIERYPKIDITSCLPFMDSILRESGNGILSEVLKGISNLNVGLTKTKALFFDEFYSKNRPTFTSNKVAKLFGNITEIREPLWIIVVDEIERAQFDEVYRLVEVVERFKNEGRSGLPTKLLFLFCISEPELSKRLNEFTISEPRASLLKTFFYEDPKSIVHKIFLPPVDPTIKENYIINQLNHVIDNEGIIRVGNISPHKMGDPTRKFLNHKEATEYLIATLNEESPRVINRIVSALDFFYGSFKDRAGAIQKNAIRFSDIVALEYIKIKYPFLIDFFIATNHFLINQTETKNINVYLKKEELKNSKIDLIGWIESVSGRKFSEFEKVDILKLVGLVMYYYFDFLNISRGLDTNKDQYVGSTSYPEIMGDYLSLISGKTETNYRKNNSLYQDHQKGVNNFLSNLENEELTSYARFIYDIPNADTQINIEVLEELTDRILTQRIKPEPMNIDDSSFDEFLFQFLFQIVVITEKDRNDNTPSKNITKAFSLLKEVLLSPIPIGAKFILLNSLTNTERGSNSEVHGRLTSSFNELRKYFNLELKSLIKSVFAEFEKRYLNGKDTLYENEENFFYTLYQGWSGSKDSEKEIRKIRNAAKRHLEKYPRAIKTYWDRYPFKKEWKTFQDVISADRFFVSGEINNGLYMPLETLLKITQKAKIKDEEIEQKFKFWNSVKNEVLFKEKFTLQNELNTLKAFLTREGFLD
jgi:hypothetical protein